MLLRYKESGCYRFLDELENVIYVGVAENIDRRINSHFRGKQGHLGKKVYDQVAIVEITKTNDYPTALALENVLINKYKPKYNRKDKKHSIDSKVVKDEEEYSKLENWELYIKRKKLNKEKINLNKKQDKMLLVLSYAVFIIAMLMYAF